jgi:hypothetical protein
VALRCFKHIVENGSSDSSSLCRTFNNIGGKRRFDGWEILNAVDAPYMDDIIDKGDMHVVRNHQIVSGAFRRSTTRS